MPDAARGPLPRIDRLCGPPARVKRPDGREFAGRAYVADGWRARSVGLLGTRRLAPGEVLWIPRCGWIHTMAMAGPIACVFLDAAGRVIRIVDPVPPWRVAGDRGARITLEGPTGMGTDLRLGEILRLDVP